jgi:hypothetical protein
MNCVVHALLRYVQPFKLNDNIEKATQNRYSYVYNSKRSSLVWHICGPEDVGSKLLRIVDELLPDYISGR